MLNAGSKFKSAFTACSLALLLVVAIGFTAHLIFRLRVTYQVQRDLAIVKTENEHLLRAIKALEDNLSARIDEHEQIIFGGLLVAINKKQPPPKMPRIEQWQVNRDKELRERIAANERRLYRICNGPDAPAGCKEEKEP